jgi:hypothetical protein
MVIDNVMTNINLAAPSPAWLGSDIASQPSCIDSAIAYMTRQQHCATTNIASPAPSLAWLSSTIASMTQQHHHQHDLVVATCHDQRRLGSTVASMTQWLDTYFPDQPSDSKVHYRLGSRAWRVPLQLTLWLRYTTTYIDDFKSRRAGCHPQDYETLHQTS